MRNRERRNRKRTRRILELIIVSVMIVGILQGCEPKAEKEVFKTFQNALHLEEKIPQKMKEWQEAEKMNAHLYQQIMQVGKKSREEATSLITKALQLADKRGQLMADQVSMFDTVWNEVQKNEKKIKQLKDSVTRNEAMNIMALFKERQETNKQIDVAYQEALQTERKMYQQLLTKETTIKAIRVEIQQVNQLFNHVTSLQQQFNDQTKKLNEAKDCINKSKDISKKGVQSAHNLQVVPLFFY
ncbi:YkyA family protein [Brevibacillus daliensis]|uniref:YkyA family protein n=1 Tax=Brevibacillus daliensis TaxID=2892995 RepID=UPI001E3820DC|nr:YkyA family protein [Brevibacillus daliensis]